MPLFTGVGARIRDRLLALGYQQANGKPDVRRFCREKSYDNTLFYFWLRDANTPVKERERLASDLGISEAELLLGVVPKAQPGKARRRGSPAELLLALGLGLGVLLWPSGRASADLARYPSAPYLTSLHLIGTWRRFRILFQNLGLGIAYA